MSTRVSDRPFRVAFVSTRISGRDGVSLEIAKWAEVIERMGYECCYIAGKCDRPAERSVVIEEAHFDHPAIREISAEAFGREFRSPALTDRIVQLSRTIRDKLAVAIEKLAVNVIIAENALTIPMNLPLGVALVHKIQEQGIACIAHHHDFYWERDRFLVNCVDDIIHFAFPPPLKQVQHVVINSQAGEEFSRRTGLSCRIVPNIMDFAHPPAPPDEYALQFRRQIGLQADDLLIVQPTRVVARKGIEHSIELIRRLNDPRAKLVITHASGDEGDAYPRRIREYAELMGVEVIFAHGCIGERRGSGPDGRKRFTIEDVYLQADLITYPSEYEGFGNAFLEAIYYRRPVVCNRYSIYRTDIEPCGLRPILFDGFLTDRTVDEVKRVLDDAAYRREMVEHNYRVASEYFGYQVLEEELRMMVRRPQNIYRMIGRGIR